MPRNPRFDEPGCLHHVMNRGIARRTVFETRADVRKLLSLLACMSRNKRIELHAYSIMATHYHLLVRSVDGNLSNTMRWVMNQYVRYFNRTRRRDGPLMRGRFKSIPVWSWVYLLTLIRYIDQNPVDAGLVPAPPAYPYGSARWLRQPGRRPLWLCRDSVNDALAEHGRRVRDRRTAYDDVFAPELTAGQREWIERRLNGRARGFDELDKLLGNSEGVLAWARRKAHLADGTKPGLALVDAHTALQEIDRARVRLLDVETRPKSGREHAASDLMAAAILRDAAGESFVSIARRLELSPSTPKKRYRLHQECIESAAYQEAYAELVRTALQRFHGNTRVSRIG